MVRINSAPTGGEYAQAVGRKTTARLLNRGKTLFYAKQSLVRRYGMPVERDVVFLVSRATRNGFAGLKTSMRRNHPSAKVVLLHPGLIRHAGTLLRSYRACLKRSRTHAAGGDAPTSGIVGALALANVCEHTTVYGIGKGGTYQYFRQRLVGRNIANTGSHSFDAEGALFKALANDGIFTLCGPTGCTRGGKRLRKPANDELPYLRTKVAKALPAAQAEEEEEEAPTAAVR